MKYDKDYPKQKEKKQKHTQQDGVVRSRKHAVLKSLRMLRNHDKTVGFLQSSFRIKFGEK